MTGQDFWSQYGDEVLGEAEKAAAEGLTRSSFGKLSLKNRYYFFSGSPETGWGVEDCDFETYRKRMGDPKLKRSTALDVIFTVDVQEMNPSLEFQFERGVRVGQPDWVKTLVPSIEAVFGTGSMGAKKRGATMASLNGAYVEVHSVPQQPKKNDKHINRETGQPYTTVSLARVFENKDECAKAYVEVFGEPGEVTLPPFPPDYGDEETWAKIRDENVIPEIGQMLSDEKGEELIVTLLSKKYGCEPARVKKLVEDYIPV
jgi:hypothetical protein